MIARFAAFAAVTAVAAGLAGFALIESGFYDVAATEQHTRPVFWALTQALRRSVRFHARTVAAPPNLDAAAAARGREPYERHCRQCHGAPGVAPDDFALGMRPVPSNLVERAREMSAGEVFWVVKHGIKMTGMPAWDYRFADEQIWDVVAFVRSLPEVVPAENRRLSRTHAVPRASPPASWARAGDPQQGARAILQYGCTACHVVPGVVGRDVRVGPSLAGVADRPFIGGVIANSPANLVRWLLDPPAVDPQTAMPSLGLRPEHARDIAAYLYTQRERRAAIAARR